MVYLKTNNIDRHANIDAKKLKNMFMGMNRLPSLSAFYLIMMIALSSQDRRTLLGEQMDGFGVPGGLREDTYLDDLPVPAGEEGDLSSNSGDDCPLSQDVLAGVNK